MKNEGLRTFTREEKLDLSRNPSGEGEEVEWEVFGREIRELLLRKIGEKWKKIVLILYIDKYTTRWIGRYQEVSRIKNSQMELSRGVHSNLTSMDREAIENLSSIQKLSQWIEKLLRSYRDWFLKTSMDWNYDNSYWEKMFKRLNR